MEQENQTITIYQKSSFLNKDNIISILGIIIMLFLLFKSCNKQDLYESIVIHSDTTISHTTVIKDTTLHTTPKLENTIHDTIMLRDTQYIPSKDYEHLLVQYERVISELLAKNIYKDTIPVDTIGTLVVIDTLNKNLIAGRSVLSNLRFPQTTVTITNDIIRNHGTMFFVGASLQGNPEQPVNQLGVDLMLLTKKDKAYGFGASIDKDGKVYYNGRIYFKF